MLKLPRLLPRLEDAGAVLDVFETALVGVLAHDLDDARGRGLKRSCANERLKSSRRRNPTSGLKLSPTFRYSARAP